MLDFFEALQEYHEIDTIVSGNILKLQHILEGVSKLNIFHPIIRSLKKTFDELIVYIENIKMVNFDIIILSETWNIDEVGYFEIRSFKVFYNESCYNKSDVW